MTIIGTANIRIWTYDEVKTVPLLIYKEEYVSETVRRCYPKAIMFAKEGSKRILLLRETTEV